MVSDVGLAVVLRLDADMGRTFAGVSLRPRIRVERRGDMVIASAVSPDGLCYILGL
jgi:hypothetical protein